MSETVETEVAPCDAETPQEVHIPEIIPAVPVPLTLDQKIRRQFKLCRFMQNCFPEPVEGMVKAVFPIQVTLYFREATVPEFETDAEKAEFGNIIGRGLAVACGSARDIIEKARELHLDLLEQLEKEKSPPPVTQRELPFEEGLLKCQTPPHQMRLVQDDSDGDSRTDYPSEVDRLEGGL